MSNDTTTDQDPVFAMSKYLDAEALYKDKANYYEGKAERLAAELAELRKDKERLDWWDKQWRINVYKGARTWIVEAKRGEPTPLRAAIDAAMEVSNG